MKLFFGDGNKTISRHKFRSNRQFSDLYKLTKDTLNCGDLREVVKIPKGETLNEWLAVNTVDFYNTTCLLYGTLSEFCTIQTCPVMSAGAKYEYKWLDKTKHKKAIKVSAPQYVSNLMEWIESLLNNETIFPSDGRLFNEQFPNLVKMIFKRMFRVYAHMYYSHFHEIKELGLEKHINTAFKHFMIFVQEFDLMPKPELEPLKIVIQNLTGK